MKPTALILACLLAGCRTTPAQLYANALADDGKDVVVLRTLGRELLVSKGCFGCHHVGGAPRRAGVDLSLVRQRDADRDGLLGIGDARWQERHLLAPARVRRWSLMPDLDLTPEEAQALVLTVLELGEPPASVKVSEQLRGVARGRALFTAFGCQGCHGADGRGGRIAPERAKIPVLARIAETLVVDAGEAARLVDLVERGEPIDERHGDWVKPFLGIKRSIAEGKLPAAEPSPRLIAMPAFGRVMSDSDIDAVGGYLVSLFPPDAWESWE